MKISSVQRRWLLAAVLAGVAGAVAAMYDDEPAATTAERAQPPRHTRAPVDVLPELALEKLEVDRSREPVADAFAPRSWLPPARKMKVVIPPPPPPQAPPVPYTYVGKMMEDGRTVVFLTNQDRSYTVRSGDRLDGTWQVDDIKPAVMLLTYLPLNQQQTLPIGSAN